MSRKVSSTFYKSKQIPRIFQRRNQTIRNIVKNIWDASDGLTIDNGSIANIQEASTSKNYILETINSDKKHYNVENVKISRVTPCIDRIDSIETKTRDESSIHEKNIVTSETVDDIEKWLKTPNESTIDLDTMKSVVVIIEEEEKDEEKKVDDEGVVEEEEEEEDRQSVNVDRYLADDLPHVFLGKDPDGLSIDLDLSDKKLNLDYDPLLGELQSDKLLEVCEKNDDFIPPEFRLDRLDPLVLSPRDMMVAGEILPPSGRHSVPSEEDKNSLNQEIIIENVIARDSEIEEMDDMPIQVDFKKEKESEEITNETIQRNLSGVEYATSKEIIQPADKIEATYEENESKKREKLESRITKKRRKRKVKSERNEITFLEEPCRIDGKDGVMAVVAISTDKISNMTQIVINTGLDEQIYQGKTSELIEASGNFQKLSKIDTDNGTFTSKDRPHERMVSKALEELGITDESLEPNVVNENGKTWLCPRDECNREFCKLHALKTHLLAHFGVRPFKCDYEGCTWAFHSEFKLKRHKETHLKRKNFVCEVAGCNRRFTTVYNLWSHEKLHTRPNRIICQVPDCHEKFQTKRALELHMKNHDQSHAPYMCNHDGCGKRYYTSNALTSHQRCHNYKETDVKCSWPGCGKIFDKPCRLKAHVRSHTGSKPYTCNYQDCQWAFSSSSKLKRHQKKHTNERKFVCNVESCGKAFMRSEHLKEHLLTHAGGGYFQCYMCDAHFSAKSSLYVHIKKHQVKDAVDTITEGIDDKLSGRINQESRETRQRLTINDVTEIQEFHGDTSVDRSDNLYTEINEDSRKNVSNDRNNMLYNCGMEGCGKSYVTLSNLANHMIAIHGNSIIEDDETPIGISTISETSDLDYILYATSGTNSNGTCRAMMLESCDAIIMSESSKNLACLPEPEPPPPLPLPPSSLSSSCPVEDNSKLLENFHRSEKQIFNNQSPRPRRTCQGSARTGLTCEDVWKLKTKINASDTVNVGATDVVLGEANLNDGLLLTEELPSMYYQDDIVGTECQILLLDTGNSENPIDLRGLE